jgi:hypothetical protein
MEYKPYGSYGNEAVMRISPIGDVVVSIKNALDYAKLFVTKVSHNHPKGIKEAQVIALAIFLAWIGESKKVIKKEVTTSFGYNLNFTCGEIRATYEFNETYQDTVPQAIVCFLEANDFEDAIRNAISIGGDSDTFAAITGGIVEAYFKDIPEWIIDETLKRLPNDIIKIIDKFYARLKMENKNAASIKYLSSINHRLSAESLNCIILIINSIIVSSRTEKDKAITFVFISKNGNIVILKYFPLRAFLSHTRFHYRQSLLFILFLRDNIFQYFATKVRN